MRQQIISTDINFKIDTEKYFIDDESLYEVYCKHNIIQDNKLKAKLFEKIATDFFEYIKNKKPEFFKIKTSFALYILPHDGKIIFKSQKIKKESLNMVDSFGNAVEYFPDEPTKGVFFCSYDDKAFTINCNEKAKFFEAIGVGNESHEKLLLPNSKKMNIAGFSWFFLDLETHTESFTKRNLGIYDQLYHNYVTLKDGKSLSETLSSLTVFCIKKTNAKLEVMLNENLTMVKMESLFGDVSLKDVPFFALESLIVTKGLQINLQILYDGKSNHY